TAIVSCLAVIVRVKSKLMCWPTSTLISRVTGENPVAVASTEYSAGGKLGTSKRPDSFVNAYRVAPVALARTSIRTPDTGRCELSTILPSTEAKLLCPYRHKASRLKRIPQRMPQILCCSKKQVDSRKILSVAQM